MFRQWFLPVTAVIMLVLAVIHVVDASQELPQLPPPVDPARSPYNRTVAGAGLVEAQTQNIAVASLLAGVVADVSVRVGQPVRAGDALFRLDQRHLQAEQRVRQASLASAEAQLARHDHLPRTEEIPVHEARAREAQAKLAGQEEHFRRVEYLLHRQAASREEHQERLDETRVARAQLERAQAELDLLRAGSMEADKNIARAAVAQARAQLEQTRTDLERSVVRAPVDGVVLQVNVRPGEYVGAPPGQPLLILGNLDNLHVRVDIDEYDLHRFRSGGVARAMLRGNPGVDFPLRFVRVDPYVIPKKSLTGDNSERVDTRVLQVIYAVDAGHPTLHVGQQLDVFIDAAE